MSKKHEQLELILPDDWDDVPTGFPLIAEGRYNVVVDEIQHEDETVQIRYKILDEGPYAGRLLFQNYAMSTSGLGRRMFKEFLAAVQVDPKDRRIDLSRCLRAVLNVRVKHNVNVNEKKSYANVVEHGGSQANAKTN